jgi:zinc-ribbon domain
MPKLPRPAVRLYAPKVKVPRVQPPKLKRRSRNGVSHPGPAAPKPVNRELLAERDRLLEKFTIMQADLGGAFYEMAIRDHVKLDVLTRKAAELQRLDVELGELEQRLELERSAVGACGNCGAAYEPGAQFCSQCGERLGD